MKKSRREVTEEEKAVVADSLGDALVRNRDLRLLVDSDLTFCSFAEAWDIISDYIYKERENETIPENIYYVLEVSLSDYHEAFLLSLASKMTVKINKDFEDYEWAINARWYNDGTYKNKRIWSPGA